MSAPREHPIEARDRVVRAALRVATYRFSEGVSNAHYGDEGDYSADLLDQSAARLVAAAASNGADDQNGLRSKLIAMFAEEAGGGFRDDDGVWHAGATEQDAHMADRVLAVLHGEVTP